MFRQVFQMQDLPLPWLSQLVANTREPQSKLNLFSSCKLLRDLTLSQADRVQCVLDVKTDPDKAAKTLKHLALCKKKAVVRMVIESTGQEVDARFPESAVVSLWLAALCRKYSSVLAPVTHVVFQADVAGALIPYEIQTYCPKMTHLVRKGSFPDRLRTAYMDNGPCQQLTHLGIIGLQDDLSVEQMQQQLSKLPNLQSLSCLLHVEEGNEDEGDEDEEDEDEVDLQQLYNLVESVQPLHQQLRCLSVPKGNVPMTDLFANHWPQLQYLCLPSTTVFSEDLNALLQHAPQVMEMVVGAFELDSTWEGDSFAHQSCKWRHLSATTIHCSMLPLLPLAGLDTLRFTSMSFQGATWEGMQAATAVLAGIPHVEGKSQALHLRICETLQLEESWLPDLLALLRVVYQDHISLWCYWELPLWWLKVLGQLQCHTLTLRIDMLPKDSWDMVLQDMPHLQTLHVQPPRVRGLDESKLCGLLGSFCMFAIRPCALQVSSDLAVAFDRGWQDMLMEITQEADPMGLMGEIHHMEGMTEEVEEKQLMKIMREHYHKYLTIEVVD